MEGAMRGAFVLTPSESKRFIAKAVVQLPEVKKAFAEGEIVIGHGSTNVYVAEEILGECPGRDRFLSGLIVNGTLCLTQAEEKPPMIMIRKGKRVLPELTMEDTLKNFGGGSVFIKGANAVDKDGNAGVFVAHGSGGTIGYAYGILSARGCHLIVPIGLEKLVPSVPEAARLCGQDTFYYSQGVRIGMVPLMNARVITEIEAFHILFGLTAHQIGGGGVNGSEGSVILVAEGKKEDLDRAIALIESIKGEPPLRPKKSFCISCLPTTPSLLASPDLQFAGKESKHCMFRGKKEEELPTYLQPSLFKS
jgi:hypothetical protein